MTDVPFSTAYVMKATTKHMRRSVDISIRKTNNRWKEFKDDPEKSKEVMLTLMRLHELRALLDDYQKVNKDIFTENER